MCRYACVSIYTQLYLKMIYISIYLEMNRYNVKFAGSFVCILAIVTVTTLNVFLFSSFLTHGNEYFFLCILFYPTKHFPLLHKGIKFTHLTLSFFFFFSIFQDFKPLLSITRKFLLNSAKIIYFSFYFGISFIILIYSSEIHLTFHTFLTSSLMTCSYENASSEITPLSRL